MSWGQPTLRYTKRFGPVVAAVAAGLAVTLLTWTSGLALWSWLAAAPSPALGAWAGDSPATPKTVAVTICWVSGVLLAAIVVTWLLRRTDVASRSVLCLMTVVALGLVLFQGRGLTAFVGGMQNYPRTAQLPTILLAWRLALLALLLLIVGCAARVRLTQRSWRSPAIVGVVAGLVLGVSTTALTVYAGSDRRFVDTSWATATPPDLSMPTALGTKRFTMQIATVSEHHRRWYVQPIAAGFVTLGDGRVTAFDGKGNERWHYRRSGPGESQVTSLQVFDDGRTVIVGVDPNAAVLVGFDATTGEQLWWSSDQALIGAYRAAAERRVVTPQPYLLEFNAEAETWTRFDTRTGTPMWTATAPEPRCQNRSDSVGRSAQALLWCSDGGRGGVRFTSADPDTGEIAWETTFFPELPFDSVSASPAGRNGTVAWVYRTGNSDISFYIDPVTRTAYQLASAVHPVVTVDDAVDFLALVGNRLSLRGTDGKERCAFSSGPPPLHVDGKAIILRNQIVSGMSPGLQTFNPNTCAPITSITLPSVPEALIAAPGVVLVVRTDATGTWIDGYA